MTNQSGHNETIAARSPSPSSSSSSSSFSSPPSSPPQISSTWATNSRATLIMPAAIAGIDKMAMHQEQRQASAAPIGPLGRFVSALSRKKPLDGRTETKLNRCLTLLDLTTLGVGSTLGLGLYVLAGQVASNKAGPAVVISFAFAALASAFSALCYAEFAGRVPRAGSAYAYSYITTGEFVAFIIGWNLILEYVIGASSVARGFSGYLRFVFEHVLLQFTQNHNHNDQHHESTSATHQQHLAISFNGTIAKNNTHQQLTRTLMSRLATAHKPISEHAAMLLAQAPIATMVTTRNASSPSTTTTLLGSITEYVCKYFDWTSIAIVLILTIVILFGVKESTKLTLVFTAVNMTVVIVVVISSLGSLDLRNWRLKKEELPSESAGDGGFMPFGWSGVLAGSATCFFGFIGFDTIASSAEEAQNPKRNVPLSIVLSLFISFLAYMSIAVVQTLLWPYHEQDNITILPYIFAQLNMPITYWIVLLGAVAGLASSQLGAMYPLPRILYSMAQDKVIYGSLAHVNKKLKLPVRATIVGSLFIALLACLLDIQDLADMVSIGTLAAYSLVSLSVLIIRYEDRSADAIDGAAHHDQTSKQSPLTAIDNKISLNNGNKLPIFHQEEWQPIKSEEQQKYHEQRSKFATKSSSEYESRSSECKGSELGRQWSLSTSTAMTETATYTKPSDATSSKSKVYIFTIVALTILLDLVAISLTSWTMDEHNHSLSSSKQPHQTLRAVLFYSGVALSFALLIVVYLLSKLPIGHDKKQTQMFMVPLVPLTPTLSILVNTFLMLNLSLLTWIRFAVWMAVGMFIYFSYGIRHSEGYFLRLDDGQSTDEHQNQSKQQTAAVASC